MSILYGAHHFVINGGQFVSERPATGDLGGIEILLDASLPDAAVDAEARQDAPTCFPGTRRQFIQDITNWATSDDGASSPIYWMRGPAGVGKSAVAQTCAQNTKATGHLGAAFFFSVNGRNDHTRFFTTIAYQLTTVLPEYRSILSDRIHEDRTLVKKKISAQFNFLIVEPLQELARRGKGVGMRVIIVDGLDECQSKEAQSEIIELIAASAQTHSTPFRWAIFSRPEPHIESTFYQAHVFQTCQFVLLPISREADDEIRLYLRGEFDNMLRRRNLLSLSTTWPCNGDIDLLVNASAGLFAYPAAVLRFVDRHSLLGFQDTLQSVLKAIRSNSRRVPCPSESPFIELDSFYMLIMKRIPEDILLSVQLLFAHLAQGPDPDATMWNTSLLCNQLGFSETVFRAICHQLHAILELQASSGQVDLPDDVDSERTFFEQETLPGARSQHKARIIHGLHGTLRFHHKSFYDFLLDPSRSHTFCASTSSARNQLFYHYVERHKHFADAYALSTDLTHLTLAPGIPNSSTLLSWPERNEYIDSMLMASTFTSITWILLHNRPFLLALLKNGAQDCTARLLNLDYRKALIMSTKSWGEGVWGNSLVIGCKGYIRVLPPYTIFGCIDSEQFQDFNLATYSEMIEKLEEHKVIKAYHPRLPSSIASVYQFMTPSRKQGSRRSGLYKLGQGDGAVYWFWEFDLEQRWFMNILGMNIEKTLKMYQRDKFIMWEDDWAPS